MCQLRKEVNGSFFSFKRGKYRIDFAKNVVKINYFNPYGEKLLREFQLL